MKENNGNKKEKKVNKNKKPNFFVKMGRKIKEAFLELKNVTWPTLPKVVKQTGVVLVVVAIFLVVISAFDYGLYNLLMLVSPK